MSIKTFFLTFLLFAAISISVVVFSFSGQAKAENREYTAAMTDCDPSQYTYERVPIGDTIWIIVYNCDGVVVEMYPE